MRTPSQRIEHLKSVFGRSMNVQRAKVLGQPTDPDVEVYNKMTQHDLDKVREQYGLEGLLRYIRHIEHKRLMSEGGQ